MADRAVRQARHDSDGDVTALGDSGASWSLRSKSDVINDIECGYNTYFVPWKNDPHTPIRIVQGHTGKYLRTDSDSTSRNNLDDLPEC